MAYAERTGKPFPTVATNYAILLYPMPNDVKGRIRYLESATRLFGDLATFYKGPLLFESNPNQRKILVLEYFSKRNRATSFDVSSSLDMSLTNASDLLRRYYKQGLLTRTVAEEKKRGRRTMVYKLTEAGQERLSFLYKTVNFKRTETDKSIKYRLYQLKMEMTARKLRQGLTSS